MLELLAGAEDHGHAVVFDQQLQEVQEGLVGAFQDPRQRVLLLGGGEIGREEEHRQLAVLIERVGELAELLAQLIQLALVARDLEQRAGVYLGELLHQLFEEIVEKSSSPSASSTSRF